MAPSRKSSRSYEDKDFEFEEKEFEFLCNYRRLSNLPTPPPSRKCSTVSTPRHSVQVEDLRMDLRGPAEHLTYMVPTAVSLSAPQTDIVHQILCRAKLPLDIIALASCILDSLSSRFARNWRSACPLIETNTECFTGPDEDPSYFEKPHIDAVPPELIILAALIIADKFVEDMEESTNYFARRWGRDVWSVAQINITERCIMKDVGYSLLPLWSEDLIEEVKAMMQFTGMNLSGFSEDDESSEDTSISLNPMSSGFAVEGLGNQLTPVETPRELCFDPIQMNDSFEVKPLQAVICTTQAL